MVASGGWTPVQPPDATITQAAQLAAWFSQGRQGQNVAVDVTPVRYVKKPGGAKPGMVIYTQYRTVYVTPEPDLAQKLNGETGPAPRPGKPG